MHYIKALNTPQMLWVILIIINSKLFLIVANPINWMLPFTIFNIFLFLFLFLRRFYRVTGIIFIASIEITFQRWQSIIWSSVFTWKWENVNENTSKPPPLFSYPCEYILQKMMNGWTGDWWQSQNLAWTWVINLAWCAQRSIRVCRLIC